MPDENSAAEEHSIIQEITAPLASLPDNAVPAVADVEFPIALRGYDRLAVDAYVKRTSQLVAELQATRSPEAAVRRALERVGGEVAGILQRAHEAAAQITHQSRTDAEDRLEDAQDLARQLLALAESAAARFPAADEVELEEPGEGPVAAALAGEEPTFDEPAAGPIFADGPGLGEPPGPSEGSEFGEDFEPGDEAQVGEESDGRGESDFGGEDATVIMPPIRP